MIALSKQLANTIVDLPVGNPPNEAEQMTLSRKVQSELNLSTMGRLNPSRSITNSVNSGFSGSIGDLLPDELTASTPTPLKSAVDCDAFVALRELGALVARRRGLKVDAFIESLMILFSHASAEDSYPGYDQEQNSQPASLNTHPGGAGKPSIEKSLTPRRTLRKFQSQPQLSSDQRRRRHFSFEPGDDRLHQLEEISKPLKAQHGESDSSDSDSESSDPTLESQLSKLDPPAKILFADSQKPSKIPSPVQTLGRVRRENSTSSLQSISSRPKDDRRDSRSSILTAFREKSSGSLRLDSKSRSSSIHNLHAADSSLSPGDSLSSLRFHNSVVALAAARAADKMSASRGDSPARTRTRSSTPAS